MVTSHGNLAILTTDVSVTRLPQAVHTAAPVIFQVPLFALPVLLLPASFSHVCHLHLHDRSLFQEGAEAGRVTRQPH